MKQEGRRKKDSDNENGKKEKIQSTARKCKGGDVMEKKMNGKYCVTVT